MYSEKRNVLQLVALLKAHDITHIVLSPGSRNSPLTHSFATDSDFTCYSVVDERSAGFFALGIIQAIGKPAAVCCTSGTATLNLGPAVAEAFYQQLPLLVVTADRPAAWIGQMDGQTIPQSGMFRDLTRRSVQLPQIADEEEEWYCNRLINEAILSLDNGVKGPSHINIPLGEPLFGFNTPTLPLARVIRQSAPGYMIHKEGRYKERFASYSKRMVIVGQLQPGNSLTEILEKLRNEWDVVVLAEQLSNIPIKETLVFDTVLYAASENELEALTPDLVITLGGHIVSKRLKQFIRSARIREHWHISPSGEVTDTFQRVTDIVRSDNETFLLYLTGRPPCPEEKGFSRASELDETKDFGKIKNSREARGFRNLWERACASVSEPDAAFSDLYAAGALMHALPENSSLQLGNSNSVRLAQLFDIPSSVRVFCNRGTNGIEGSLSTAVGYASSWGELTFLLIGDLSFFYDMNGLWNNYSTRNLRILLNNNGGGEIFGMLPGLDRSEVLQEYIAAAHTTQAKAWAEQQGFLYLSARNAGELEQQLPRFTDPDGEKPVLLEVFTSMEKNAEQIRSYYHHQKRRFKLDDRK
ncbi:2-succinyl-5-enolpyruvyl-6-hydroxy-3-cyclohexene-1-carboxylic-acid synthase [Proteiniphilum sp. X52]|uniref:2-succinyl-5-enolpyruvyl-6-hydroxy-3- cyclohexene-1-carboxylic-acid synthase n=1 Tax=Proteiniphilum sp. X52 TaxID=2382159 RepID=UPI000F0A038D|nr:2-succinyl-5-enolpyruvyl-6-hydroxy-3-cyclohexene-1-carboxylic-acid synthase [Proteiniphilum sp. X52]RNC63453.1 2-succinyl-5-enolpyruvyl-6-hydroxy-3-cyclohexene-1-carboxylic-acid synthase [Proteiniphilum sp. X52]